MIRNDKGFEYLNEYRNIFGFFEIGEREFLI